MTVYEKNLKAIEEAKPYLYERMQQHIRDGSQNSLIIEMVQTLDNDTTLVIKSDEGIYRLSSIYSPVYEASRWALQYNMQNIGITAAMFGLGNGCFVREIAGKLKGRGFLAIYEPSPQLFYYCLENYDLTDILENPEISLTVEGINDIELKNVLGNTVDWVNLKSQLICIHPPYNNMFPESLNRFYSIMRDNANRVVVNKNTDIAISSRLVTNMLANMRFMPVSNIVTDLQKQFPSDVPAIIVAAGPSLDKNIEELKKAKGRSVIFAVDTAVKYMLAHEILPDFIVTLDPKKSMKHLNDPRCCDIPIFGRPDCRTENLRRNKSRIIFYCIEGYIKALYNKIGKKTGALHSGGSVATGAFTICETLGFNRIILVGQDLAYQGDCTHAGGISVDFSNAGLYTEMVEDIYGNPIKTRYDWYVYIRWFEDAVALFEGSEVIDATEGGAKIKGTTIMTLREAIEKYCTKEIDCAGILSGLEPAINKEELSLLLRLIEQDREDLMEILRLAREALHISGQLLEKYEKSITETRSSLIKVDKLSTYNGIIESKDVYELVDWDMAEATTEKMAELYIYSKDEKKNKLKTYEHAEMIYKAIISSGERIAPLLDKAYNELKTFI